MAYSKENDPKYAFFFPMRPWETLNEPGARYLSKLVNGAEDQTRNQGSEEDPPECPDIDPIQTLGSIWK